MCVIPTGVLYMLIVDNISDADVLKKVSVFVAQLPLPLKKSLLLALTIFSHQNKKHIQVSESRLSMIQIAIQNSM